MNINDPNPWLRKLANTTREQAAVLVQRAKDLEALADALDCFWEHVNVSNKERGELEEALKRLLWSRP